MKAIVLAAGKGTRLRHEPQDPPKALRLLRGKPLIRYVLDNLNFLPEENITIVVGFMKDEVKQTIGGNYHYVEQLPPFNGTAKATLAAEPVFGDAEEPIIVCYCDTPFFSKALYQRMFETHIRTGAGHTLLAAIIDPPPPFGRFIRDADGRLLDIVEESAATPEQRKITEVNAGIQVLQSPLMWSWLRRVDNDNPKGEYYLTKVARVLAEEGVRQEVVLLEDNDDTLGVNTVDDLKTAEARLAQKEVEQ